MLDFVKIDKTKNKIVFIAIVIVTVILGILLCYMKSGYYIDEMYTYTLANGEHLGIAIDDGKWNDTASFFDEISVSQDSRFDFKTAADNTATDVHPPLYYWCVNVVSSLFPGMFSKWFAFSINITSAIICELLLYKIALFISQKDERFSLLSTFAVVINPAFMSNLIYFRMYFLLSSFALIYMYIHLKIIKDQKINVCRYIAIFIVGYLGFMTHYYMLFVMFSAAFFLCIYLFFFEKKYVQTIIYGMTVVFALVMEYLTWPMCIAHMFYGYRGQEAASALTNVSGISSRIAQFFGIMNHKAFGLILPVFLILVIIGAILELRHKNNLKSLLCDKTVILKIYPCFVSLGYFLAVSLTALDSNRFLFPMEMLFYVCLIYYIFQFVEDNERIKKYKYIICMVIAVSISVIGISSGNIDYLFRDCKQAKNYIENDESNKVLVFQGPFYDAIIASLIHYDKVYFASEEINNNVVTAEINDYVNSNEKVTILIEDWQKGSKRVTELLEKISNNEKTLEYVGPLSSEYGLYVLK